MADFCRQCGELYDLGNDAILAAKHANLTAEQVQAGYFVPFLCEGCGPTLVDHEGSCAVNCMKHHITDKRD
jgi:hypothetical protein